MLKIASQPEQAVLWIWKCLQEKEGGVEMMKEQRELGAFMRVSWSIVLLHSLQRLFSFLFVALRRMLISNGHHLQPGCIFQAVLSVLYTS